MSRTQRIMVVALGIAALAVPGAAIAKHGENHGKAKGHANGKANNGKGKAKGHNNGKSRNVGYVFKGFYAGDSMVDVKRGNAHVRKGGYIDEMVEFDLTDTRIVARDTDGDGERTLADVSTGDWVLVKSKLPKGDAGEQPFEAKRLIDKTSFRTGTE